MTLQKSFILSCGLLHLLALSACGANDPTIIRAQQPLNQGLTADTSVFNFEASAQGWTNNAGAGGCAACTVTWVGTEAGQAEIGPTYLGTGAIKYHIVYDSSNIYYQVHFVNPGTVPDSSFITYAIFLSVTSRAGVNGLHVFDNDQTGYAEHYISGASIPSDGWVFAYHQLSSNVAQPLTGVGVGFDVNPGFVGDIYIDSVNHQ